MGVLKDITGKRYGKLVVTGYAGKGHYHCICDCGEERDVLRGNLVKGRQTSCGCYVREINSKRMTTHGESKSHLYIVWAAMKRRCYNPNSKDYKNYGGRGIILCPEWKENFTLFRDWAIKNGYKQGLQIDRKDTNGNYEPSNCRWVTQIENENNRRDTKKVIYNNKQYTLRQLADEFKISRSVLYDRIYGNGFTVDEAVNLPVKIGNNQTLRKDKGNGNL